MRALAFALSLFLVPQFLVAESPAWADQGQPTKAKKKAKTKKKAKDSGSSTSSPGSIAIDTSMPVTATMAAEQDPDDMGIVPLDVSHMLFDAKSIKDIVMHHMPQIQSCYDKVLAVSGERIEGRVMVLFTIDTNGTVYELKVLDKKSTISDDRVRACVTNRVKRLVFPQPPDNRRYPIEFPFDLKVAK